MEKNANELLDKIISLTFARHTEMPKEDYLKALGRDITADEDFEIRSAKLNLLVGCTKELIKSIDKIQLTEKTLTAFIKEN